MRIEGDFMEIIFNKLQFRSKVRSGKFPETAARPATPAPPPVQTHRDNRPVYVVVAPASRGLHIRFEPSARSAIVATLHQRDRVFVGEGRVCNNRPPSPVDLQKVTSMNGYTGWINADLHCSGKMKATRGCDPIMSMNKQCAISSWNSSADMFRCELGAAGRRP